MWNDIYLSQYLASNKNLTNGSLYRIIVIVMTVGTEN